MRYIFLSGVILVCGICSFNPLSAENVITVNDDCSLVDAITAANTDTAVGGCAKGSGTDIIELTQDVLLTEAVVVIGEAAGLPSIDSIITVRGNYHTITRAHDAPNFHFFYIEQAGVLTLQNVTLTGGTASFGGAIRNDGGTLRLEHCQILDNVARDGGGIINDGTLTIIDSLIAFNEAYRGDGGGISNNGSLIVENSIILNNRARQMTGGGISNWGEASILNSVFRNNLAAVGGGLANSLDATARIVNSTFSDNTAEWYGGGISSDATLTLTKCTLSGNSAQRGGGLDIAGRVLLNKTIIANNTAKTSPNLYSFGAAILTG